MNRSLPSCVARSRSQLSQHLLASAALGVMVFFAVGTDNGGVSNVDACFDAGVCAAHKKLNRYNPGVEQSDCTRMKELDGTLAWDAGFACGERHPLHEIRKVCSRSPVMTERRRTQKLCK